MNIRAQCRARTRQFSRPPRCQSESPYSAAPDQGPSPRRPRPDHTSLPARARPRRKNRAWAGGGGGRGAANKGGGAGERGVSAPAAAAAAGATAAASGAEELAEALPSEPAQSSRPVSGRQRRQHSSPRPVQKRDLLQPVEWRGQPRPPFPSLTPSFHRPSHGERGDRQERQRGGER